MSRLALGVALAALLALVAPATAGAWNDDELYGITPGSAPHLVSFAPTNPVTFEENAPISGIGSGELVVGMDVSPRDGNIYLLTRTSASVGRLYVLDASSADATLVAQLKPDPGDVVAPTYTGLADNAYGVDFNPQSNLLRVTGGNTTTENLRVNPANALVTADPAIKTGVRLAGIAYHNNDNDTLTPTLQYGYDYAGNDWGTVAM